MKDSSVSPHVAESGSPAPSSRWLQVDGARNYLGGVSRKTVYAMVAAGMKVARLSEQTLDARGRLSHVRMWFCREWIDEFLEARSGCAPLNERVPSQRKTGNSPEISAVSGQQSREIATALRQPAENEREVVECAG